MLKRKVYSELLVWRYQRREEGLEKCLLLKGARKVGKTYIVKEFGKTEYESFIYINLYKMTSVHCIFEGEPSSEEIYKRLTANVPNVRLIPKNTLIFIDEIQCSDNARKALKVLAEDKRYDVIVAGALPDISEFTEKNKNSDTSYTFPSDYERHITMYPLDFEEFLWSNGFDSKTIHNLEKFKETGTEVPESLHNKYENLFREYIVVGGMPEVVYDFAKHKDFARVYEIQKKILDKYHSYIEKFVKGKRKNLVRRCYDSVPRQLNNELKRFKYSIVEKGQTKRKYGSSIEWLIGASIVNSCCNASNPSFPLKENCKEEQFKLYINDTGLLTCIYGFETKRAILNDTIKGNVRAGIYENVIAQCLISKGYNIYYYKPDDNHEVEFVIEKDREIVPIEVKSGKIVTKSLENYINDFSPVNAYKLVGDRNSEIGSIEILPHYFVMFI